MLRVSHIFTILTCVTPLAATAADDLPEVLHDTAIATYEESIEKCRRTLLASLQTAQAAAQKRGDLETFKKVSKEINAFSVDGTRPSTVYTRTFDRQMLRAKNQLKRELTAVVAGYTKAGSIASATAAQSELDHLKAHGDLPGGPHQWVSLFNGKSLDGWVQHPKSSGIWGVRDGMIVGRGPNQSHLFTQRDDYSDFHLRAEMRVNATGNSGICFRTDFFGEGRFKGHGYEANVDGAGSGNAQTGSLLHVDPKTLFAKQLVPTAQWFKLDIIAVGDQLTIKVNGQTTVDTKNTLYSRGHIAIQQLGDQTEVHVRKIQVKSLP
ncbi:3-keto-disaccharide hydrolase [Rosistilla oblonga]|uniref:3-keto-disaccharide hydrolase n=1 Tax=Rosistilla oblonga TaxID=2527990 RepID=UPI003A96FC58